MKHVFALFSNASKAESAIKKLSENDFDIEKARIHSKDTIDRSIGTHAMPAAHPTTSTGAGSPGMAGGTAGAGGAGGPVGAFLTDDNVEGYLGRIGVSGGEHSFYSRGIREGGYLVSIDVPNDQAEQATRILADADGRAPQAE